ncbi:MAG: ABC transporter ATP-binding protein [Deltaproteobacteria bacterium]|nr:ABC transporter ATP-binding protein [Deltaproteobacteria bacterium]
MSEQLQNHLQINAQSLEVNYGSFQALNIEHLAVRGRIIALVGHNGSGKSTLIKTLLQLLMPRHGYIVSSLTADAPGKMLLPHEDMAFSPEEGAIFEDLTVASYFQLWCRLKRGSGNYYKNQGLPLLEKFQVQNLLHKYGRQLSKGQRRRVQMVVGFLSNPRFFLFDEPFDGLDVEQTSRLVQILSQEAKQTALLISSHRMEIVERLADALIVLKQGKVSAAGTLETVCQNLCPCGFAINLEHNSQSGEALTASLREYFSPLLISPSAARITLYGKDIAREKLVQILQAQGQSEEQIIAIKPSLIEAMHYHLL